MVRETRHLWIGNLPETVREEEIRDLFERHGRVQSVKLLSDENSCTSNGGPLRSIKNATVAFIDIRSASKALRNVRAICGQPIEIQYHEPGSVASRNSLQPSESLTPAESPSISSDSCVTPCQNSINQPVSALGAGSGTNNCIPGATNAGVYRQRFSGQHGQSEDSSSHFYDQPKSFSRGRGDGHGFHVGRGRRDSRPFHNRHSFPNDNRNYRSQWGYPNEGRFAPPAHSEVDERPPVPPAASHPPNSESSSKGPRRPESPASSVSSRHIPSKRHRSRSVSESGSTDRGSSAGSRSRSGSRSSVSTSVSSGRSRSPPPHHGSSTGHFPRGGSSSGGGGRFHHNNTYSRQRYSRSRGVNRSSESRVRHSSRSPVAASPSSSTSSSPSRSPHRKVSAPHSPSHSPSSSKSFSPSRNMNSTASNHHHSHSTQHHRRNSNGGEMHAAIKIRNLPSRSSDTSLKDGLYHEYKKHGKVSWVRVCGVGAERYAIVCFKSTDHASRAVSSSQDKLFFGCKIQVTAYHHKSEDIVAASEEENSRTGGEEEHASVGYPTRTILITGLDVGVTTAELRSVFDQYGDIVEIKLVRKPGTATHAVCEFVDIASAIRAQWGRHVFKSRETRVSFYRNPATTSLLLDGTSGVNEKQVYSNCSQYGAIKRIVMDTERILALVEFEEISVAQTAIHRLRSWVIKGKHLQVDFASPEVIKIFQDRVATMHLGTPESSSPSFQSTGSPSFGVSKDRLGRRVRNKLENDDATFRRSNDGTKSLAPTTDIPCGSEKFHDLVTGGDLIVKELLSSADADQGKSGSYSRLREGYTSPVSPDAEQLEFENSERVGGSEKSSSRNKIDLSCHETDSAIVTSSSDVIVNEKSESDMNLGSSSSSVNGDDKLSSLEFDARRVTRKAVSSDIPHSATGTVDGVSSTSPEPKPETVRKASPDPGIGCPESGLTERSTCESEEIGGVSDPRKKMNESKIRRSSADSGNTNVVCSSYMHSTSGSSSSSSSLSSVLHVQPSTTASVTSGDGNDSDDNRPGTPLCDENPECFTATENTSVDTELTKQQMSTSVGNPISLPLPGFALSRQRVNSSSSKESPSSSVKLINSAETLPSEIKSPSISASEIASPSNDVDGGSDGVTVLEVENSSSSPSNISAEKNSVTWSDRCGDISNTAVIDPIENLSSSSVDVKSVEEKLGSKSEDLDKKSQEVSVYHGSDSESISTPGSPTSAILNQRVQKCCESYDLFNGNRENLCSSQSVLVRNPASLELTSTTEKPQRQEGIAEGTILKTESITEKPRFRHKFLDLDELRHQPSDIGKSVLARRSVFDEDQKRLENYGEKYEAKAMGITGSCSSTKWRALAFQRSSSTASTSSTVSNGSWQATPISPATPLTPPVSGGSLFNCTGFPTPHQAIPTPSRLSHQTPSLSSHSGLSFPLSSANCGRGSSPILPNNKPSFIPNVFQNNSQPMTSKDKQDLIINQAQGSSNASNLKINTDLSKTQSNSSVNNTLTTPTPPNSSFTESGGNIVQPSPHQGSTKKTVESSSKQTISKQNPSEKSSNILMKSPCATVVSQSSISSSNTRIDVPHSSNLLQPIPAPGAVLPITSQPMVHQGLPRAVERSVSLDSKKTLPPASWNNGAATPPIIIASTLDHVNSIAHKVLSLSGTNVQGVVGVQRRSSVDSHSSNFGTAKVSTEHSSSTSDLRQGDQSPAVAEKPLHEAKPNIEKIGSLNNQCHNLKSERSSMKHTSESDINPATRKEVSLRQPQELNFIKQEVLEMRPIHQEATVAVVASESSPFIPSRSDAHSSSSSKDSSSKDKDRKAKSSSSSTSVSTSANPPSATFGSSGIKADSNSSAAQQSQKDKLNCSKGGSSCDDKKEKKEKPSSSLSGNSDSTSVTVTLDDNQNVDCVTPNPSSKKSDEKRDKREKKDSKDGRDFSDHSSHKKDKEGLGKRKRRASSQDVESQAPDQKKTKSSTSKDSHMEISHHHRLKNTSNTERRESRDSSCSGSKDKLKEKEITRSSVQHQPSEEKECKDKEDYRSRESSHRSKEKSSSSSSNSKEKHRGEKSRTPSEIRTNFHSVKNSEQQHSSKDKERERQRKEKNSPGKENVKGSKHHSSSSSHHSGSSKSKSGGLPPHKASSSSSSKERSRSQGEKHSSFESEPENVPSKSSRNSSGSVDGSRGGDSYVSSHEKGSSTSKSDKHEKRDSSGHRRERHRSGGFDTGSDKSRNNEQKKKKKVVIEDTDSSDSDEDSKKKHHSIFEVVIDNYVSMYDKVKARSNRACKSNVQTPQQEKNKKQDKNDDPFRHLKQSRAKKIDKKRSTSMDESNKSVAHTSSDEDGLQMDVSAMDLGDGLQKPRDFLSESPSVAPLTQSSDEEDDQNLSQMKLARSSKSRRLKNKKKSSSDKHSKKRGRKSSCKQSPPGNPLFSAPSVFSNSDYESNASSSHTVEPSRKKKRLSSSMNKTSSELPKTASSPRHLKSSEDSMSDSDDDINQSKDKIQHHKSSSSKQIDNYHSQSQKKLLANDVYSDSDSSVVSGPVRSKKHSPPLNFGKTKSKEKLGKQKSMKKSLFESSDSSDTEKAHITASSESRPEKSRDSGSLKSKERENKLNRKKYRPHGSASGSKSNKSSKKPKGERDVGSDTIPTRRESGLAMKELLFGAMTSSSESESVDKGNKQHKVTRLSVEVERPKTPTIVPTSVTELPTCKSPEDETSKKLKPTLTEVPERKISLSPSSSQDTTTEKENVVDSYKSSSSVCSEKKKKKHHHKDKKSKRQDTDSEHGSTRSKHVQPEASKEKTDIDSLFNSPKHTSVLENTCILPAKPSVLFGPEDCSVGFSLPDSCKSLFGSTESMIKDIKPIVPQLKDNSDAVAEAVQSIPGMFSSDEDDDDDNKLKIRIGQAIEQSNEPETNIDSSILEPKQEEVVDQKLEEDEKKSLFEQDKAIQSIVLLEKSPPGSTAATVLGDDEVTIPKECPVAISQEETEDAVAAILNFDGEEVEPASSPPKRSPTPPRVPSTGLSPPTLVITEGSLDVITTEIAVPVSAAEAAANVVAANIQSCIESVVSASSEVSSESPAITVWSQSSSSPSLLSDTKVKVEAQMVILPKEDASTPKTPETQSRKSSIDSAIGNVKEDRVDDPASKVPSRRSSEQPTSRRSSNELDTGSADVYDFHDSDDESSSKKPQLVHSRQTPPIPTVGTKSPMASPPLPSAVLPSPPAILSPPIETLKAQQSPNPVISVAPVVQLAVQVPSIDAPAHLSAVKETQQPTMSPVQLVKPKVETPPLPKAVIPIVSVVTRVKTPPTSTPTPARNTVDEIIEHVIHMAQLPETESEPALTITSVMKPVRRRSRSRSKDSPVELDSSSTMSITKVINRAGESSPRVGTPQSVITSHSPQLEIHRPSVFAVGNVPKVEKEQGEKIVDNNNDPPTNTLETLIDPQTGILMPMLRKDEGQYVPIGGQNQDQPVLPKLQQPQFTVPSFHAKLEDSLKCASERPPSRPLVHQQSPHIHQQQQLVSVSLPKTEGLAAAIMAQKAIFVQPHVSGPHTYGASHSPTTIGKTSPHQPVSIQVTNSPSSASITSVHQNHSINPPPPHSNASGLPQIVPKSIVFGPPPTSHSNLSIQSPTAKTFTAVSSHGGLTQLSSPPAQTSFPVSHSSISGTVNVRAPFSSQPTPQIVTSQSGQFQYAIFSRPGELGTNRPIIRHVIPVINQQQQQLAGRGIASHNSPSGHMQADMGNFQIQIPDATTITKISTKDDDQSPSRKSAAILSHTGVILPSHQGVGDSQAPGPLKSATNSAPSSLAMTQQQRIHHEALQDVFVQSAKGLIQVNKNEPATLTRTQDAMAHPPRIEIPTSVISTAASPKMGRLPMAHESTPPTSAHQRVPLHALAYEPSPMEHRVSTPHSRGSTSSPHYSAPQSLQQMYHSPHHIPIVSGANTITPSANYGMRVVSDKPPQMEFKPRTPEPGKGSPTVLPQLERGGPPFPPHLPQHSIPPHHGLHPSEQRNSDSPMVTPLYDRRHVFPHPNPAHQGPPQRAPPAGFRIVYADPNERMTQSPSYPSQFMPGNQSSGTEGESRDSSPYPGIIERRPYSPPPAHGRYSGPPNAEAPSNERPRQAQVLTPPHASQVPPQGDSLLMLLQRYPIMWQGLLALKNDNAACQMHFVSGNIEVARDSLPSNPDGSIPPLRISQRMRLEQTQLEGVARKMQTSAEHCILLALPCGRDHLDVLQQSNNLRNGFITYLQLKQAAGIVNIHHPVSQQVNYVIHIFPSCDFANENLARIAPDLLHGVADIAHLLIVIATTGF